MSGDLNGCHKVMHQDDDYEMHLATSELSEQEVERLKQVLDRAKEFDQKNKFNEPLEGSLLKWTNVVKGWQDRFFQLDPSQCVLHYHMTADKRIQPPRGSLHLWGAEVSPSEEDSQSFQINGSNGVTYRLRSENARERQKWVSHLRAVAASATTSPHQGPAPSTTPPSAAPVRPSTVDLVLPSPTTPPGSSSSSSLKSPSRRTSLRKISKSLGAPSPRSSATNTPIRKSISVTSEMELEPLDPVTDAYLKAQGHHDNLIQLLEGKESYGVDKSDKNVLMVKALSEATLRSLKDYLALSYLQKDGRNDT